MPNVFRSWSILCSHSDWLPSTSRGCCCWGHSSCAIESPSSCVAHLSSTMPSRCWSVDICSTRWVVKIKLRKFTEINLCLFFKFVSLSAPYGRLAELLQSEVPTGWLLGRSPVQAGKSSKTSHIYRFLVTSKVRRHAPWTRLESVFEFIMQPFLATLINSVSTWFVDKFVGFDLQMIHNHDARSNFKFSQAKFIQTLNEF